MASYVKKKSAKQEKRTAQEYGGRTQVASGAIWSAKGDVRTDQFLIENKFTDADSYKLELPTWNKIELEATKEGLRTPLMQIDIQDLQLVVLKWDDVFEMLPEGAKATTETTTPYKSTKMPKYQFEELKHGDYGIIHFVRDEMKLVVMENSQFQLLLDL